MLGLCSCINVIEVPLFQLCKKHHFGIDKPEKLAQSPDESKFLMKTLSQIKSNVAVPIKKKVLFCSATFNQHTAFPVLHTSKCFELLIDGAFLLLLLQLTAVFCPPAHCSIPLPSRLRKTKRRSVQKDGCWMSCTRYSWTRTLSTTA